MFPAVASLLLAALVVQGQIPPNCNRTADVQPGDSCFKFEARNHVSTYQLQYVVNKDIINPDCTNIFPGQTLCLGIKGQDCSVTYPVEAGDTCYGIATKYKIPLSTLEANNVNQCTPPRPLVDEVLCVSGTVYNYTTTA